MESIEILSKECILLLHKNKLLQPLIRAELEKEILNKVSISIKQEQEIVDLLIKELGLTNNDKFEEFLKSNQLSKNEFNNLALRNVRLKKHSDENFGHKVESRFLERKNELDIIVYSLLRVKDAGKAREFYLRIEEKEAEFSDLAAKFSEGIEKKTCGIVGPTPIGAAHPILQQHLQNKPIGVVQPPILIEDSYIIVRVESFEPAQLDNFMREKMALELFNNWLQTQAKEISHGLLKKQTIKNYTL